MLFLYKSFYVSVQRFSYIRYTGLDKFGFCVITVDIVESLEERGVSSSWPNNSDWGRKMVRDVLYIPLPPQLGIS